MLWLPPPPPPPPPPPRRVGCSEQRLMRVHTTRVTLPSGRSTGSATVTGVWPSHTQWKVRVSSSSTLPTATRPAALPPSSGAVGPLLALRGPLRAHVEAHFGARWQYDAPVVLQALLLAETAVAVVHLSVPDHVRLARGAPHHEPVDHLSAVLHLLRGLLKQRRALRQLAHLAEHEVQATAAAVAASAAGEGQWDGHRQHRHATAQALEGQLHVQRLLQEEGATPRGRAVRGATLVHRYATDERVEAEHLRDADGGGLRRRRLRAADPQGEGRGIGRHLVAARHQAVLHHVHAVRALSRGAHAHACPRQPRDLRHLLPHLRAVGEATAHAARAHARTVLHQRKAQHAFDCAEHGHLHLHRRAATIALAVEGHRQTGRRARQDGRTACGAQQPGLADGLLVAQDLRVTQVHRGKALLHHKEEVCGERARAVHLWALRVLVGGGHVRLQHLLHLAELQQRAAIRGGAPRGHLVKGVQRRHRCATCHAL
eukprot:scaffold3613_cov331-Prasinococcus_capsulatus_cf.AAC.6